MCQSWHEKGRPRAQMRAQFSLRPHAWNTMVLVLTLATRSHAAPHAAAFAASFRPQPLSSLRAPAVQARRAFTVQTFSSRALPKLRMSIEIDTIDTQYQPGTKEREIVDRLLAGLESGLQDSAAISQLEQGTQPWLDARKNRLTASNFGAAAGRNRFMSPKDLAREMLYSTFKGNEATRWGNAKEPIAMDHYVSEMKEKLPAADAASFSVSTSGLHLCETHPWLAASPDGHSHISGTTGLIEIKCPFSQKIYPRIPDYYYDQVQGLMAILGYEWADFVVWTPKKCQIQRVPFQAEYWQNELQPALRNFYVNIFIPAYVERELAELQQGPSSSA